MANTMRWRYGDTEPVSLPVDSATVIEIGDLLYLDTDDAKPASAMADQQAFHDKFAGVAMQATRNGDTQPIRVATAGVFEFDCDASHWEVGQFVSVAANGIALKNQSVLPVKESALAIGRCAKRVSPVGRRVLVDINSQMTKAG